MQQKDLKYTTNLFDVHITVKYEISIAFAFFTALNIILW